MRVERDEKRAWTYMVDCEEVLIDVDVHVLSEPESAGSEVGDCEKGDIETDDGHDLGDLEGVDMGLGGAADDLVLALDEDIGAAVDGGVGENLGVEVLPDVQEPELDDRLRVYGSVSESRTEGERATEAYLVQSVAEFHGDYFAKVCECMVGCAAADVVRAADAGGRCEYGRTSGGLRKVNTDIMRGRRMKPAGSV